ncbi:butyrophilin-like protein 10 [Discoglossus pictus]
MPGSFFGTKPNGDIHNSGKVIFFFRDTLKPFISKMLSSTLIIHYFALLRLCTLLHASMVEMTTYLHGTAELPCTFSFVSGPESLYVSWQKRESLNDEGQVVHNFREGEDHYEHQDPKYKGRTKLSTDLSRGIMGLILINVTFSDEGIYYCRAANLKDRGDIPVKLTIDRLSAREPSATALTVDGKRRLNCFTTGVFREPQIEWIKLHNREKKNLTNFSSLSMTNQEDGSQLVESVLDYNVKLNVHYLCTIKEGRLGTSIRVVISDGQHAVTLDDDR